MGKLFKMPQKKALETGVIYCADNLEVMKQLPSESIDLIYIDPPFFSGRHFATIWGDQQDTLSFNDRWKGGIYHYVDWMRVRLEEMYRLLKPTGNFFIHLDYHAVHYLKVELDKIFGYKHFRNEIIWKRTVGGGNTTKKCLGVTTDTILFYSKSNKNWTFNKQYTGYDEKYIKSHYYQKDENGRFFQLGDLTAPNKIKNNDYEYKGYQPPKNGWRWTEAKMKEMDKKGLVHFPDDKRKRLRQIRYLEDQKGNPLCNLWIDIPPINSQAKEDTGYPTQKPEALLERIIKMGSNEGDIVADFFCGCGTTLTVSQKTKRKWLGVDCSPKASKVIRSRLSNIGYECREIPLKNLTKSQILEMHHRDFEEYMVRCIGGEPNLKKVGDGGIDGRLIADGTPIQIKQSKKVGRPVIDSFYKHLKKNNRGIIIAISFTKSAYEETAKINSEGFHLQLLTVDQVVEKYLKKAA